jgi:hypothetical protein
MCIDHRFVGRDQAFFQFLQPPGKIPTDHLRSLAGLRPGGLIHREPFKPLVQFLLLRGGFPHRRVVGGGDAADIAKRTPSRNLSPHQYEWEHLVQIGVELHRQQSAFHHAAKATHVGNRVYDIGRAVKREVRRCELE